MPYFIETQARDKHCVRKGTEDAPGEIIECHPTRPEATAHLRALYANVEDATKSVTETPTKAAVSPVVGSMIHGSGGILNPMRDGDNDDAPSACICPECGHESKKIGQVACADRLCPKCGSKMQAKENDMDEETQEVVKATWDSAYVSKLPNSAFLYVESGGDGETPKGKRHLPYRDSSGKVDLPHLRNAISRLGQSATGTGENTWLTEDLRKRLLTKARGILKKEGGGDDKEDDKKSIDIPAEPSKFTVYKSGDSWRWLAISNVAVRDREGEIITEKAYNDAIAYAREHDAGELDLVHVNGTDVGHCDLQHVLSGQLIEGGTWLSDKRALSAREAVQSDPDYWGVSIKFAFDPDQFDGQTYHGGIRILKRSILPRHMAASYGTAIAVTGGESMEVKQIDEDTKAALQKLGVPEDEIAVLAEKQVGDETNVKTKEEDKQVTEPTPEPTPEPEVLPAVVIPDKPNFIQSVKSAVNETLKAWFTDVDDATDTVAIESESTEPATTEPAVVEQPQAEKEVEPDVEEQAAEVPQPDADVQIKEAMDALGQHVAKAIGEAVAPLQEIISQQQEQLSVMEKRLVEAEKDVETKTLERIDSLPPVVKVQPSYARSTVTPDGGVGLDPVYKKQVESFTSKLMSDISREVAKKVAEGEKYKV